MACMTTQRVSRYVTDLSLPPIRFIKWWMGEAALRGHRGCHTLSFLLIEVKTFAIVPLAIAIMSQSPLKMLCVLLSGQT